MNLMKLNRATRWQTSLAACALVLASCGGADAPEDTAAVPTEAAQEQAPAEVSPEEALKEAIAQRGEPCDCVAENKEAMSGLLESMESTPGLSAQELNLQIAKLILPCMKPVGQQTQDIEYSRAMGKCDDFQSLTEVMLKVKTEVQKRVEEEASRESTSEGTKGKPASEILDNLKKKN